MAFTHNAVHGQKDACSATHAELRIHNAVESPAGRMEELVRSIGCPPEALPRWNKLLGDLLRVLRGNAGQQDRIVGILAEMEARVWTCFGQSVREDIGQACTADDIDAIVELRMSPEDCANSGFDMQRIHPRTTALYRLAQEIPVLAGASTQQLLATASRASAVLNQQVRGLGIAQSAQAAGTQSKVNTDRSEKHMLAFLGRRVNSLQEFVGLLSNQDVIASLSQSTGVLTLALRRLSMLSVHFMGHDAARLANKGALVTLLTAGTSMGLVEQLSEQQIVEILIALRQLLHELDAELASVTSFVGSVSKRGTVVAAGSEDLDAVISMFHNLSRLRVSHPNTPAFHGVLLQKIGLFAGGLSASHVCGAIESWRRSGMPLDAQKLTALEAVLQRGRSVALTLDCRQLVSILSNIAECPELRRTRSACDFVVSAAVRGVAVGPEMEPVDIARSLRSLGLIGADGVEQRQFQEVLTQRGAMLLSNPQTVGRFNQRDVGMSMMGIADTERMQYQSGSIVATSQHRADFIDRLADRATKLASTLDLVSGTSTFTAFAHIEHRSRSVESMLRELARTGPKWVANNNLSDADKNRQLENLWAIARIGLSGRDMVDFARFLTQEIHARLPNMNLAAVSRSLWSVMVIQHQQADAVSQDVIEAMLLHADVLLEHDESALEFQEAMQLYHAQAFLRGKTHKRCAEICTGDAGEWLATGRVVQGFRRGSDMGKSRRGYVSSAEQYVHKYLVDRFGANIQHDVLHHGFELDVAVRLALPGQPPRLIDVEVDGACHQAQRFRHVQTLRDNLLESQFGTIVVRLPFTKDMRQLGENAAKRLRALGMK